MVRECPSKNKQQDILDGLVQERRNSIANTLELRLSCTNPSYCDKQNTLMGQCERDDTTTALTHGLPSDGSSTRHSVELSSTSDQLTTYGRH